jgi:two-component system sensor histidine kinase PilS (NtrC family)
MEFVPRAGLLEDESRLRKMTFLRLVVATVVIGAAIMVLRLDEHATSVVALFSLLGVIYLSTGSVYIAFTTGVPFRPLLWLQIYTDVIVLTMILHYSGGASSYFSILYILPVIVGGLYFQISGGLIAATLAAGAYLIYSVLEMAGYLKTPPDGWIRTEFSFYRPLLRGYLNIVVFYFTGALSGYVSKHIHSKGEELADRERELRRVQLNTDSIIQNMSSGLIVTNMKGEVLTLNPAALDILGLSKRDDYKGRLLQDVIPHMPVLASELAHVLGTGTQRRRHELEVRRADGGILPLGISISILRAEDGEKKGIIALFQDLTEVHRMRTKVRQADKMAAIGKLSASIAHEIRAPLASICGSIEMLSGDLEVSGDSKKLMDLIMKESDRLDRIITDFLEFARVRKPKLTAVNVEQCIEEMVLLLRHTPDMGERISMKVECECKGIRIRADEEQIKQVFLNLGLNACEAMRKSGSLVVSISRDSVQMSEVSEPVDCVHLAFENTGPHIPDDAFPHLFEPFFTTKEGGTGLGLAIAARIIESHSGSIRASNRDEGGTVFTVLLPVYVPENGEKEQVTEELISF